MEVLMKVSVLGFGTVGRGVYEMIGRTPGLEQGKVLVLPHECTEDFMVTDIEDIVNDPDTGAVVECIGGIEPAGSFAEKMIKAGKHLVTSNKAMVAARGIELADEAKRRGRAFLFSAACGGGVPFLHNLSVAGKSDRIKWVKGILNGTTNYILDRMQQEHMAFEEALAEAKEKGYAEADPSADISGLDSYRKIMLASAVSFGTMPEISSEIEGIGNYSMSDVDFVSGINGTVKLMARAGMQENGDVYAYVEPVIIKEGVEVGVRLNYNCASYEGEASGPISLIGQGAGRWPTASAVLRDLTGIMDGCYEMMPQGCRKAEPVNSDRHEYIVRCEDAVSEKFRTADILGRSGDTVYLLTGQYEVREMHKKVKELREKGHEVFFAALEV